jgi:16S rRNA (guanine1207-N2)-methyltransferase
MITAPFLLSEFAHIQESDRVLVLNSAADAFVTRATHTLSHGTLILAEDNIAILTGVLETLKHAEQVESIPFHDYISVQPQSTIDVAVLNLFYQPSNAWMLYAMYVAAFALKNGGSLYVVGAKDRGIITMGKHMQEIFGNVELLKLSKGTRVFCSSKRINESDQLRAQWQSALLRVFASGEVDAGTAMLIDALDINDHDNVLDLGCGAGHIGLAMARHAASVRVTMLDASLMAVEVSQQAAQREALSNVRVLPSDGASSVYTERFDLVATNPPFHVGGEQTTRIAERFIHDAAHVLQPQGRLYLVANRFLKYEDVLHEHFKQVEEVAGDTRYKVLRSTLPQIEYTGKRTKASVKNTYPVR